MTNDGELARRPVHLEAPAKLTWFLEILGRRDNGYHELRSEMMSISLCEELIIDGSRDSPVLSILSDT